MSDRLDPLDLSLLNSARIRSIHALLAAHRDRQEREIERLRAENDALAEALAAVDRAIEAGRNK